MAEEIVKMVSNIAIFDLDYTISKRDTYIQFLIYFLKSNPWRLWRCYCLPVSIILYKIKLKNNSWLKEKFLEAIVGGITKKKIEVTTHSFVDMLLYSGLYPQAIERINYHNTINDYLILSTASFDFYVKPLARKLGFDKVICTHSEWDKNDCLTGKIAGENCYGENKKVATEIALKKLHKKKIFFYSDHHSDLPLFSISDFKIAINPTKKLRKEMAVENNFTIMKWR